MKNEKEILLECGWRKIELRKFGRDLGLEVSQGGFLLGGLLGKGLYAGGWLRGAL